MSESGILIVHLRERVPELRLRDELAEWLGVSQEDLVPLDAAAPSTLVPYQYLSRARGFRVTIEVYAGQLPGSDRRSDLALAQHLARCFSQDALVSPTGQVVNPYQWLLVRPDGTSCIVFEIASDDGEDGLVIAEPQVQ